MANGERGLDAGRRRRPAAYPVHARDGRRLLECLLRSGRLVCRAERRLDGIKKHAFSRLTAAGSRRQGYDVGGRPAESCMDGCYASERALGAQQVGKASAHLLSRHCMSCPWLYTARAAE